MIISIGDYIIAWFARIKICELNKWPESRNHTRPRHDSLREFRFVEPTIVYILVIHFSSPLAQLEGSQLKNTYKKPGELIACE